ncbi:pkd2 [Symbiodinium pilosum]|uniref:Pkd2 protein n=1 Tax=Symbiodinium pilosum TaxID=2952 RepID=A0A812WYZ4_SYMPI|nr:pkd2 [Symbiodinium pilosum]
MTTVPCGIFDDPKLVADVNEAVATIKKAMVQIGELSASMTALNVNQMTRWINTKEEHAGKIITLMSEYCLCQRIKPVSDPKTPFSSEADYIAALQSHHQVMLAAVKCKQNVDPALADTLAGAVAEMSKMYWGLSDPEFVLKTMSNSKPCDMMKVVDSFRKDEEAHFVLVQKAPKNITLLDKEYADILPKTGKCLSLALLESQKAGTDFASTLAAEEAEAAAASASTTTALPGADGSLAEQMVIFPGLFEFMTQRDKDVKQHLKRTKLRSLCVYLILAILSVCNVYLLRPSGEGYYCTKGVSELLAGGVHSQPLETIRDIPEVWEWLEKTLVAEVFTDNSTLRRSNYLVGYLQVRQQEVAAPSALHCKGIEESNGNFSCVRVKYEENSAMQKEHALLKAYWLDKLGQDGRSVHTKPWEHHRPSHSTSGAASKAASYEHADPSGFRLEYNLQYTPLSEVRVAFLQDMAFLRSAGWISAQTRALHISFVSYNAAYLKWIWSRFTFELSAYGTIHAMSSIQLYRPRVFDYGLETDLLFTDVSRFVLVFYILFQVYWDFSYAQQKNGVGWKHLVTAQALADAVIVILFIVVFALRMSYLRSESTVGYTVSHVISFQDAGRMAEYYALHAILDTVLMALCTYRFFYFLRVNRQVYILWATVHRAFRVASRLVLLLALPVLVGFVLCHMAVAGPSVESGRTFGGSFARTLILLFGDNKAVVEYEPNRFYELAYNVGLFYMGRLVIANTWTAILMQEYQKTRVAAGHDPKRYRWKEFDWVDWILAWPLKNLYLRLRPSIRPVKRFHDDDSLE